RPVASGRVSPAAGLAFGIALGVAAFVLLATNVNLLAAVLSLSGLLGYVFVYTMWLKRSTPQNIVTGGAAGAVPPLVAWAAVTGGLTGTPLYLFAIVFFWTPPHFWALSLLMKDEYARAGVPMLPVVRGERETRRQILLYTVLLYAVSQLPFCAGAFGMTYLVASVLHGAAPVPVLAGVPRRAVRRDGRGRAPVAVPPPPPNKKLAVVACMDARVNVERILGLEEGDAHVIRNAGALVTDDVKRSLETSRKLGTERVILMLHTDCG